MIPLKINNKDLCEIFEPTADFSRYTGAQKVEYMLRHQMFPTEVSLSTETYSRDAERTADYELESLLLVNRKAKPEFVWSLIKASYVTNLMSFLSYAYDFKNNEGDIVPKEAATYQVQYRDLTGMRTIDSYLGQSIEGTLVEYEGQVYWQNFRIAFPEK